MTKLPQSCISFNTEPFLSDVLSGLVASSKLQSWVYVKHQPEEDTKKEHIHLLVVPASPVNPVSLRKSFIQPCKAGDLGCLPFRTSKVGDWLLYALHYAPYLLAKGISRVHSYSLEDVESNEPSEYIENIFFEAKESLTNVRISSFLARASQGLSFAELCAEGLVPPSHVVFYEKMYRGFSCPDKVPF